MLTAVFSRIFESRCVQNQFGHGEGEAGKTRGVADMKGSKDGKGKKTDIGIGEDNAKMSQPDLTVCGENKQTNSKISSVTLNFLGEILLSTNRVKRGSCLVGRSSDTVSVRCFFERILS